MTTHVVAIAVFISCISRIHGHGYLREPISRNALSLKFPDVKPNLNRMELNCGGADHQWTKCNGECGVCGDPCDDTEKAHEPGGFYFDGRVGTKYQSGEIIDVEVVIVSHHKGHFRFHVAEANPEGMVTQEKLDLHLLKVSKDNGTFVDKYDLPDEGSKMYKMKVKLPDGFKCKRCVFQWYYTTGDDWECDRCAGRPNPETFVNCADIKIIDENELRNNYGNESQKIVNPRSGSNGNGFQGGSTKYRNSTQKIDGKESGNSGNGVSRNGNQTSENGNRTSDISRLGNRSGINHNGNHTRGINGNRNKGSTNHGNSSQVIANQRKNNQGSTYTGSRTMDGSYQGNGNEKSTYQGNRSQKSGRDKNKQTHIGNESVKKSIRKPAVRVRKCVAIGAFVGNPLMIGWCELNCNHDPPFCPTNVCVCNRHVKTLTITLEIN